MLYIAAEAGRINWATHVKDFLFRYGFGIVWIHQMVGDENVFINEFPVRVSEHYTQEWVDNIENSAKLRYIIQTI